MMDSAELARRFTYHPPVTKNRQHAHENVRDICGSMADLLNEMLPDGREKALAITHLEQTMFWANAAIARDPNA